MRDDVLVIDIGFRQPYECCMCDEETYSRFAVPYYCGPVREGQSDGCYAPACEPCYKKWEKWNDNPPNRPLRIKA